MNPAEQPCRPGVRGAVPGHDSSWRTGALDHVQVRFWRAVGHTLSLSGQVKQLAQGARYVFTRTGPVATAGYDLMAYIKSRPEVDRPDIQVVAVPFALDLSGGFDVANYPGMYLLGYQIRPNTESSLHITASDPGAPPDIHANYVQDEGDRPVTGTTVDHLRGLSLRRRSPPRSRRRSSPGPRSRRLRTSWSSRVRPAPRSTTPWGRQPWDRRTTMSSRRTCGSRRRRPTPGQGLQQGGERGHDSADSSAAGALLPPAHRVNLRRALGHAGEPLDVQLCP